jgi:hypothetical protein
VSSFEMALGVGLNMELPQSRYDFWSAHEPAHGFDMVGRRWRAWRITMKSEWVENSELKNLR